MYACNASGLHLASVDLPKGRGGGKRGGGGGGGRVGWGGVPVCVGAWVWVGGGMVAAPMEGCQEVHRLNEFVEGALSADFIHLVRSQDLLTDLCSHSICPQSFRHL